MTAKTKLTDLQKTYLHTMIEDGPLMVGHQTPTIKRTLDGLVDKGRATKATIENGWTRYTAA